MKNKELFKGIIPPIITPLKADRTIDEDGMKKLIDFDIENGVHGIFTMGSSGEAMMVDRRDWLKALEITVKHVNGRAPVFCGVIDTSTVRVIENIRAAEQVGAVNMVVTPCFYLQNVCQDEIIRHYEAVAAATKNNIVVYNIPGMTHVSIQPDTIAKIADIDNVVAYKDSCADWEQVQRELFLLEDKDIAFFNGAEELCSASMLNGAQGCVPGLANFFPKLFVDMYYAAEKGDVKKCYDLQKAVWELRKCLFIGKHWMSAMKHIGATMGFGEDIAMLPIEPLTEEQKKLIDQHCKKFF